MKPSTVCYRIGFGTLLAGLLYGFSLIFITTWGITPIYMAILFSAVFYILSGFCMVFER